MQGNRRHACPNRYEASGVISGGALKVIVRHKHCVLAAGHDVVRGADVIPCGLLSRVPNGLHVHATTNVTHPYPSLTLKRASLHLHRVLQSQKCMIILMLPSPACVRDLQLGSWCQLESSLQSCDDISSRWLTFQPCSVAAIFAWGQFWGSLMPRARRCAIWNAPRRSTSAKW